jgi:isopenicillin-N N-acyltransferase-like protein
MGEQIGEACREAIQGFAEIAIDRVRKTVDVSREAALVAAETLLPLARDYSADSMDELAGMARASGLSLSEVMLLQIRNQLVAQSPNEGCTSISFGQPFCAERVFGQNWDADSALDPFTVVLTRRPTGKPAFTSLTQAGLIAYIGGNSLGMGVCLNALPAPTRFLPERGI